MLHRPYFTPRVLKVARIVHVNKYERCALEYSPRVQAGWKVVARAGVQPATFALGVRRSMHLSYRATWA